MKFGKYLEANREEEWAEWYINYNELKGHIDAISANAPDAEAGFLTCLEANWTAYKEFMDKWVADFTDSALTKNSVMPIIRMNAFMYINQESLRKIIKKHDKNSQIKLGPSWEWKISYKPFLKLLTVLKKISSCHEDTREADAAERRKHSAASAPSTPRPGARPPRKQHTYWVSPERIMPLICLIIQHLPMVTFGSCEQDEQLAEVLRSVYLDNGRLDVYHKVLEDRHTAESVQFQFAERNADSVFAVRKEGTFQQPVTNFIEKGKLSGDPTMVYKMRAADVSSVMRTGKLPMKQVGPNTAASEAEAKASEAEAETAEAAEAVFYNDAEMTRNIGSFIREGRLKPMIGTECNIIKFALPNAQRADDSISIELEMDVTMIREQFADGAWYTPKSDLNEKNIYRFPNAVLNVYLKGGFVSEPPSWFTRVIQSNADLARPMDGFSKYAHAVFTFYSRYSRRVPRWIEENMELFKEDIGSNSTSLLTLGATDGDDADSGQDGGEGGGSGEESGDPPIDDFYNDVKMHRMRSSCRPHKGAVVGGTGAVGGQGYKPVSRNSLNGSDKLRVSIGDGMPLQQQHQVLQLQCSVQQVFVGWLLAALLVGMIGIMVITLGADSSSPVNHWGVGTLFVITSIAILAHAARQHHSQLTALASGEAYVSGGEGGNNTTMGYVIVATLIVVLAIALAAYSPVEKFFHD